MCKFNSYLLVFALLLIGCGGEKKKENKPALEIKKEIKVDTIEQLDSTEIKKRQAEMLVADSLQKAEDEKRTKAKQDCATKVRFLEEFYEEYFNNPEKAVSQYCSSKLYNQLSSEASQYEGNAMPIWKFASGSGANVSYRVNIPDNEFSNLFVVDFSEKGKVYKVYLTVVGTNGYYSIDNVKNSLEN